MRKDIKKRLEKALITLKEPGGSTIRSIIKVINKEVPVLSLRKVLEALQQGINEGFLCMYNGRFKLKQHTCETKGYKAVLASEQKDNEDMPEGSDNELTHEDFESENEDFSSLKNAVLGLKKIDTKMKVAGVTNRSKKGKAPQKKKQLRRMKKREQAKEKPKLKAKKLRDERSADSSDSSSGSLIEINLVEKKPQICRQAAEKPEVKKQRGPRCTSMKKDVRMPSKVHIPFVPPSVPQRSSTFNELLRRSPDPVNGPLFDNKILLIPENLGFFGTFY